MKGNTWAMLCHLAGFASYATGVGGIVGTLLVWAIKKDEFPEVDLNGKAALNFNISMHLYALLTGVFVVFTFGVGALIGVPILLALVVIHVVCTVMGALAANEGRDYGYALTIRMVR